MNWQTIQVQDRQLQQLINYNEPITVSGITPNAGVEVFSYSGRMNAIYDAEIGAIRKLNSNNPQFKAMPNRDLLLYNDHLQNPRINTIVADGFMGTGKTSTVCSHMVQGLMEAMTSNKGIPMAYISKPHEELGKSYGHLPGDLDEKTAKEFQSYFQYFDRFGQPYLADELRNEKDRNGKAKPKMLEVLVFEYLRGRDIDLGWIIVDESQNTNVKEMGTFIGRIGDGAKLIIVGDSSRFQIDKRGNDTQNNGLTFAKGLFTGKRYAGTVEMQTVNHILRGKRVRDLFMALKNRSEVR